MVKKIINEEYEEDYSEYSFDDDDEYQVSLDSEGDLAGGTFIEDGVEYEWVQSYGDVAHLDFDSWQIWEAVDVDADEDNVESKFFVVDIDTGFIDWGPVDTAEEAREFLQSKIDDYNDDDDNEFDMWHYDKSDRETDFQESLGEYEEDEELEYISLSEAGHSEEAEMYSKILGCDAGDVVSIPQDDYPSIYERVVDLAINLKDINVDDPGVLCKSASIGDVKVVLTATYGYREILLSEQDVDVLRELVS